MEYKDFLRNQISHKEYVFDSLNDLYTITKEYKGKGNFSTLQSEIRKKELDSFYQTKDIDEALELLKSGWKKGIDSLNKEIKLVSNDKTYRSEYNIVGGNCSVARYLQGIPTNMILQKQISKNQKVLNIYKNISYAWYVTSETIMKESIKAVKIIQQLESQGYRINLYALVALKSNSDDDEKIIVKVKLKSSSERLNIAKLAFPLIHPSFFRRIIFKLIENAHYIKYRQWEQGYGILIASSHGNQKNETKKLEKFIKKHEYIIPSIVGDIDKYIESLNVK